MKLLLVVFFVLFLLSLRMLIGRGSTVRKAFLVQHVFLFEAERRLRPGPSIAGLVAFVLFSDDFSHAGTSSG